LETKKESKVNIFKINLSYLIFLTLVFFSPSFAQEKDLQDIRQLREDIQVINLLNNLDLKKAQMKFIIEKAEEAKSIQNDKLNKITACKSEAYSTYGAIKQEVEDGRAVLEKKDAKNFIEIKHKIESITKEAQTRIDKIAQEVELKLGPHQLVALDNYKPCIIPRLASGRIGQSDPSTGIMKILEQVKAAPESKYTQRRDTLVNRILERVKEKAPRGFTVEEPKARTEIMETFERIRNMDGIDFQIKKASIAQELRDKIFPKNIEISRKDKIKRFLLSGNVINILQKRLGGADSM
jgi:hypothetical protein